MSKLDEMLKARQAPGLAGISSGPGSGSTEMVFDRPDKAKEMEITARRMELNGSFKKDPQKGRQMRMLLDHAKARKAAGFQKRLDYQNGDHPLDK